MFLFDSPKIPSRSGTLFFDRSDFLSTISFARYFTSATGDNVGWGQQEKKLKVARKTALCGRYAGDGRCLPLLVRRLAITKVFGSENGYEPGLFEMFTWSLYIAKL